MCGTTRFGRGSGMGGGWYPRWGKRVFDLALAIPLAVVSLPFFVMVAIFVRLFLGSPVLFQQQRPGRDGRVFWMVKFRTMTSAVDEHGKLLPDDVRLTRFGSFLRMTSLDEIPELWNVIKGDMSLVGPRPLLVQYLDRYTPEQARRHEVRPGVTGWAQANGRNAVTWEQKFAMDVWYVDHVSLGLDLKVLWRTLLSVVKQEGISSADHATAPEFSGTRGNDPEGNHG